MEYGLDTFLLCFCSRFRNQLLGEIYHCSALKITNSSQLSLSSFRYKDFADAVVLCAKLGNYTKDDELIVVKKAQTIVDCFIDSQIAPKIQVKIRLSR